MKNNKSVAYIQKSKSQFQLPHIQSLNKVTPLIKTKNNSSNKILFLSSNHSQQINSLLLINRKNSYLSDFPSNIIQVLQNRIDRYNQLIGDKTKISMKNKQLKKQFVQFMKIIRLMKQGQQITLIKLIQYLNQLQLAASHNILFKSGIIYLKAFLYQSTSHKTQAISIYKQLTVRLVQNQIIQLAAISLRFTYNALKQALQLKQGLVILKKLLKMAWMFSLTDTQFFVYQEMSYCFNGLMDKANAIFFGYIVQKGDPCKNKDFKNLCIFQMNLQLAKISQGIFIQTDDMDLNILKQQWMYGQMIQTSKLFNQVISQKKFVKKMMFQKYNKKKLEQHILRGPVRSITHNRKIAEIKDTKKINNKGIIKIADKGIYPIMLSHKSCLKNLNNFYHNFVGEYFDLQKRQQSWSVIQYLGVNLLQKVKANYFD